MVPCLAEPVCVGFRVEEAEVKEIQISAQPLGAVEAWAGPDLSETSAS